MGRVVGVSGSVRIDELRLRLETTLRTEFAELFGAVGEPWIRYASDYFWDEAQQDARLRDLKENGFLPGRSRVLDLAAGYGQYVLHSLEAGYDCWGVEPDLERIEFVREKLAATGRPAAWAERMRRGVGEALPFGDDEFDCVSSYQTMEHVQDPARVIREMVRVTRPGGAVHIRCPDYRSTFEGHYRLPWLPLMPRSAAKAYLAVLHRPTRGLDTICYVTRSTLLGWVTTAERSMGCRVVVTDLDRSSFENGLRRRGLGSAAGLYPLYRSLLHARRVFREELSLNFLVRVVAK